MREGRRAVWYLAPRAMIETPAFRGSSSVLSWLPPSGKMPMHLPFNRLSHTALYKV